MATSNASGCHTSIQNYLPPGTLDSAASQIIRPCILKDSPESVEQPWDLDLADHIVTCDAIHCQKNLRNRGRRQRASDRATQRQPADPAATGRSRFPDPE